MSVHLLIDAGNTRLKWGLWDGARLSAHGGAVHAGSEHGGRVADGAAAAMASARHLDGIVVGNVAGEAMAAALDGAASATHGLACRYVCVVPSACGVRIAYAHPDRLGVDRWLALLAAHEIVQGPALVVDAGTALTVDALAADGRHLGGLIAPGVDLMRRALLARTARIGDGGEALPDAAPELFAADTGDAVTAGAVHGNAALVDRAARVLTQRVGAAPRVLLTGGAAAVVAPAVETSIEAVDDLVLRGLARLVEDGRGSPDTAAAVGSGA